MAMSKIIQLCCEVADLSSPVVCNSSPEGFLPGSKVNCSLLLSHIFTFFLRVYLLVVVQQQ